MSKSTRLASLIYEKYNNSSPGPTFNWLRIISQFSSWQTTAATASYIIMKAYPFLETGFRRKMKKNVNEDQIALVTIPPVIVLKNVEIEHFLT